MPFRNIKEYAEAIDNGAIHTAFIHKTGAPASFGAGRWGDLSMGAGIPKYNAYVGVQKTATQLIGAGNDGIYTGTGGEKYLHTLGLSSNSTTIAPANFTLCDYLLHYPLIDGDDTDIQDFENPATLPRYVTGAGVQCFAVCTTPMTANANITVNYTNSDGVAGRTSSFTLIFSTVVGCIVSSSNTSSSANSVSPFIPLDSGDKGIRSIESVQLTTPSGGFFALVLVKPLIGAQMREANTVTEVSPIKDRNSSPRIYGGAYLNFIYLTGTNGTPVTFRAYLDTVWR